MEIRDPQILEVIRDAERIVYREKWRVCEERAADVLAATTALCWTRLFPESPLIQVVAVDGEVIGRVRRSGGHWVATGTDGRGPLAGCDSFRAAVVALVCEARRR